MGLDKDLKCYKLFEFENGSIPGTKSGVLRYSLHSYLLDLHQKPKAIFELSVPSDGSLPKWILGKKKNSQFLLEIISKLLLSLKLS